MEWRKRYKDNSVILMMDANGDASDAHFQTFIRDTGLHDVVAHFSPELTDQSTYINGKKRLDYILVSEDLLGAGNRAGHTDFFHPFISDHRGVYWDVFSSALFESNKHSPQHITFRGLQLERPSTVEVYIWHLTRMYIKHRILHRARKLETQMGNTTAPDEIQKLQHKFSALDMERVRYMKRAEVKCKRQKNNTYDWSPALARMGGRVTYWKKRREHAKDGSGGGDCIHQQKELGIQDSGEQSLPYIDTRLRSAWTELHAAQKSAGMLRQSHLEALAAHKGEEEGTSAATELKKLIHVEKVRHTARKHGWYLKKKRQGMVTYVRITSSG